MKDKLYWVLSVASRRPGSQACRTRGTELQQLYWGGRLAASDHVAPAAPLREAASFDSSYTTTPQEYAGWGAGLFVEPALKVTFAGGNRDLVLHYESHETTPRGFNVTLKDIKSYIFVTLHYRIACEG